jgi:hypothetical protein
MRRRWFNLLVAGLMFSSGVYLDSYLRTRNSGITDCFCMTFKCRVVTVADNPQLIFTHPIETVKALWSYTRWE